MLRDFVGLLVKSVFDSMNRYFKANITTRFATRYMYDPIRSAKTVDFRKRKHRQISIKAANNNALIGQCGCC